MISKFYIILALVPMCFALYPVKVEEFKPYPAKLVKTSPYPAKVEFPYPGKVTIVHDEVPVVPAKEYGVPTKVVVQEKPLVPVVSSYKYEIPKVEEKTTTQAPAPYPAKVEYPYPAKIKVEEPVVPVPSKEYGVPTKVVEQKPIAPITLTYEYKLETTPAPIIKPSKVYGPPVEKPTTPAKEYGVPTKVEVVEQKPIVVSNYEYKIAPTPAPVVVPAKMYGPPTVPVKVIKPENVVVHKPVPVYGVPTVPTFVVTKPAEEYGVPVKVVQKPKAKPVVPVVTSYKYEIPEEIVHAEKPSKLYGVPVKPHSEYGVPH